MPTRPRSGREGSRRASPVGRPGARLFDAEAVVTEPAGGRHPGPLTVLSAGAAALARVDRSRRARWTLIVEAGTVGGGRGDRRPVQHSIPTARASNCW